MKKILVVVAHPDDEVLGCGGTVARHIVEGDRVYVVYCADGITSRKKIVSVSLEERNTAAFEACQILGTQPPVFFGFPDNQMDSVPLLKITQILENILLEIHPSVIYTHHGGDLNVDHRVTHQAVMTACRPIPARSVTAIYSFETPSSTEWSTPSIGSPFSPNLFVDISETAKTKRRALQAYTDEMRDFPHSRSFEAVESLARWRGASAGLTLAEAFQIERIIRT